MRYWLVVIVFFVCSMNSFAAKNCSPEKINELLAEPTDDKPEVFIACNVKLSNNLHTIKKKLVIQSSSANKMSFDCNGSAIAPTTTKGSEYSVTVRSVKDAKGNWSIPQNIIIKNCNVFGSIRIYGMAAFYSEELKQSSYTLGHTQRTQQAAPKNISLNHITLTGNGLVPLYFSPGVTHSSLINSEIKGNGNSVAIYLDTESAYNTIKNNYIHVDTSKREQIAVDGSAYNRIVGNSFGTLSNGGIYLYRNCGERGVVRHQEPQYNQIVNNVFYYNKYKGINPAVWIGSRNTLNRELLDFLNISYCDDDNGYDFGSSKYNEDFARYNVIAENQLYKRSVSEMIRETYSPNYYFYNETVSATIKRKSGCYFELNNEQHFIRHGDFYSVDGDKYVCDDNLIK